MDIHCLSPCGESGLKLEMGDTVEEIFTSLPVWGEWIEINYNHTIEFDGQVSPRVGRVD